jgi:hypothetical protein
MVQSKRRLVRIVLPTTHPPPSPFHVPGQTVSLKSEKFEMDLGRLAPASEVTAELKDRQTMPFLKW